MSHIIVYQNPETIDKICIIYPTGELSLDEVAKKDVPQGLPYKILDTTNLPDTRLFRDAWECDFSNPDGHGLGHKEWYRLRGIEV